MSECSTPGNNSSLIVRTSSVVTFFFVSTPRSVILASNSLGRQEPNRCPVSSDNVARPRRATLPRCPAPISKKNCRFRAQWRSSGGGPLQVRISENDKNIGNTKRGVYTHNLILRALLSYFQINGWVLSDCNNFCYIFFFSFLSSYTRHLLSNIMM